MGRSPPQILLGTVPPVPPKSPLVTFLLVKLNFSGLVAYPEALQQLDFALLSE